MKNSNIQSGETTDNIYQYKFVYEPYNKVNLKFMLLKIINIKKYLKLVTDSRCKNFSPGAHFTPRF